MPSIFDQWNNVKQKLHNLIHRAPYVSEGDVWWISFGENVGSEINGKSEIFSRPGIIYKKLSHSFYLVVPTTTKPKVGSWYVPIRHKGKEMVACLHQIRTVDHRRLSSKLGRIDDTEHARLKDGFRKLYL
ncbi:MAG: type II toxin-antitoxin system PemK/MazF family toxin [Candidatus Uhrbacteria bacterium]|nr:type II toxin-antitoxin system PemK/MazF family toxin [Candidatus Uhrbacteria bacterium]